MNHPKETRDSIFPAKTRLHKTGEKEIKLTNLQDVGVFPRKHERRGSKKCLETKMAA